MNTSSTNRALSSPPAPARSSRYMFLSSLGSLGIMRTLISSSRIGRRGSSSLSSSLARSPSSSSPRSSLFSSIASAVVMYSRAFSTSLAMEDCSLLRSVILLISLAMSGELSRVLISSYRSINGWSFCWNINDPDGGMSVCHTRKCGRRLER